MSALAQRIEDHPLSRAANDDCFNGGLRTRTKYAYDANGNMVNRDGDVITWYSHNLPKRVNYGSDSTEFWYGPDRRRYKQVSSVGGATTTTRYVGDHFEVETAGGLTTYRHRIWADGSQIGLYERKSNGTFALRYLHKDHLGSVITTANQKWEYEPFGTRWRTTGSGPDDTERGFTGHEHLDSVALIHMNGRVQDPNIGRFISADPFVSAPYNSQSHNRYSYVLNNPVSLVDPSGFDPDELVHPPVPIDFVELPVCPFAPDCQVATPEALQALLSGEDIQPAGLHFALYPHRSPQRGAWGMPQGGFSPTSWRTDFFVFNPIGRAIAWPGNFVAPFWQYDGQQVNPISGEMLSIQTQQDVAVLSTAAGAAGMLRGLAARGAATIDTSLVRFTQSSVSQTFRTGENINDVARALQGPGGDALAASFQPIRIFRGNGGQLMTLDNRRLLAFSQAGRQVPYVWAARGEVAAEAWKFTATAEQAAGWLIRVK